MIIKFAHSKDNYLLQTLLFKAILREGLQGIELKVF